MGKPNENFVADTISLAANLDHHLRNSKAQMLQAFFRGQRHEETSLAFALDVPIYNSAASTLI